MKHVLIRMLNAFVLALLLVELVGYAIFDNPLFKRTPIPGPAPQEIVREDAPPRNPTIGSLADPDTDGDGMPDSWELANFLNPNEAQDAGSDFDLDGLTALQEFQNGKNPLGKWKLTELPRPSEFADWVVCQTAINNKGKILVTLWRWNDILSNEETAIFIVDSYSNSWERVVLPPSLQWGRDINDSGTVAIEWMSLDYSESGGLLRSPSGGITQLVLPNGHRAVATRLNSSGDWIGVDAVDFRQVYKHGAAFEIETNDWITWQYTDINDFGEVLGVYTDPLSGRNLSFIRQNSWYFSTGLPGDYPFVDPLTNVWLWGSSINLYGEFTGVAQPTTGGAHKSYVFSGEYSELKISGAPVSCFPVGVDKLGRVAGLSWQPELMNGFIYSDHIGVPISASLGIDPWDRSPSSMNQDGIIVLASSSSVSEIAVLQPDQDQDGDGMPDDWEDVHGFNKNYQGDATGDQDGDGTNNLGEYLLLTDPHAAPAIDPNEDSIDVRPGVDTDGDRIPNVWEWQNGLDYLDPSDASKDSDRDGYTNLQEYRLNTDPNGAPHYRIQEIGSFPSIRSVDWSPLRISDSDTVSTKVTTTAGLPRLMSWSPQAQGQSETSSLYTPASNENISVVAVSASGAAIASVYTGSTRYLTYWSSSSYAPINFSQADTSYFGVTSLSPNGKWLVGWRTLVSSGAQQAFVWKMPTGGQTYSPQPLLPPSGAVVSSSSALQVNDFGHVIGRGMVGSNSCALKWNPASGSLTAVQLPLLPGGTIAVPTGISNTKGSIVVGTGNTTGSASRVIIWNSSNTASDLGLLSGFSQMGAPVISARGNTIAGWAFTGISTGKQRCLFTAKRNSDSWKITQGGPLSRAYNALKVNDHGEVFGQVIDDNGSPTRYAYWSHGRENTIESLIPSSSGFTPVALLDLNSNGTLLATADRNGYRAHLLLTTDSDTDGDGLPDAYENANRFKAFVTGDGLNDSDGDGLTNLVEYRSGTNPLKYDSDGDGMSDRWEIDWGFNPNYSGDAPLDADSDGVSNLRESQIGTIPTGLHSVEIVAPISGETLEDVGADGSLITSVNGSEPYEGSTAQVSKLYVRRPVAPGQVRPREEVGSSGIVYNDIELYNAAWRTIANIGPNNLVHLDCDYQYYSYGNQSAWVDRYLQNGMGSDGWSVNTWLDILNDLNNSGYPVTLDTPATTLGPVSKNGVYRIIDVGGTSLVVDHYGVLKWVLPDLPDPGASEQISWVAVNDKGDAFGVYYAGINMMLSWRNGVPTNFYFPDQFDDLGDVFGSRPVLTDDGKIVLRFGSQNPDGTSRNECFLVDAVEGSVSLIKAPGRSNFENVVSLAEGERIVGEGKNAWVVMGGTSVLVDSLQLVTNNKVKDLGWREFAPKVIASDGTISGMATLSDSSVVIVQIHPVTDSDNDGVPDDWERSVIAQLRSMGANLSDNVALFDPKRDHDGDGVSLIDEWRRGTSDGSRSNLYNMASLQGVSKDRDNDGIPNAEDAEPDDKVIDWQKTAEPLYVLKELCSKEEVRDGEVRDRDFSSLSSDGTVLVEDAWYMEVESSNGPEYYQTYKQFSSDGSVRSLLPDPYMVGVYARFRHPLPAMFDVPLPSGEVIKNVVEYYGFGPFGDQYRGGFGGGDYPDSISPHYWQDFDAGIRVGWDLSGGLITSIGHLEGSELTTEDGSYPNHSYARIDGHGNVSSNSNMNQEGAFWEFDSEHAEYLPMRYLDENRPSIYQTAVLHQTYYDNSESNGGGSSTRIIDRILASTGAGLYVAAKAGDFERSLSIGTVVYGAQPSDSGYLLGTSSSEGAVCWVNGKWHHLSEFIVNIGQSHVESVIEMRSNGMAVVEVKAAGGSSRYALLVPIDASPEIHSDSPNSLDSSNPPYAREVKLNGVQQSDGKPQEAAEIDLPGENTSVDALTRRLRHDSSIAYVDVPASDLDLAVKISVDNQPISIPTLSALNVQSQDGVDFQKKLAKAVEVAASMDQIGVFGAGWRTNLDGGVVCKPRYSDKAPLRRSAAAALTNPIVGYDVEVIDENGQVHQFESKDLLTFHQKGVGLLDPAGFNISLEKTPSGTPAGLILKKKFGTSTYFTWKVAPPASLADQNSNFTTGMWSLPVNYSATISNVVDRYTNEVSFTGFVKRPNPVSQAQRTIAVVGRPDLKLTLELTALSGPGSNTYFDLVTSVTNPRGYKVRMEYDWIDCWGGKLPVLSKVVQPDGTAVSYGYGIRFEFSKDGSGAVDSDIWKTDSMRPGAQWGYTPTVLSPVQQALQKEEEDDDSGDEQARTSFFHVNLSDVRTPGGKHTSISWQEDVRCDTTLVWQNLEVSINDGYPEALKTHLNGYKAAAKEFRIQREWKKIDKAQARKGATKVDVGRYVSRSRGVPDVVCGVSIWSDAEDCQGMEIWIGQERPQPPVPYTEPVGTAPSQQALDQFLSGFPDLAGSENMRVDGTTPFDIVTSVGDASGRVTKYRFTDFHTIRVPGPAVPPPIPGAPPAPPLEPNELLARELSLCIASGYNQMEFYHDDTHKVLYEFDPKANYALKRTVDLNGNITEYEHEDSMGVRKLNPVASYYDPRNPSVPPVDVFQFYEDPTAEVRHTADGITTRKEWKYDPATRLMTSEIDARGNETEFVIDAMGRVEETRSYQGLSGSGSGSGTLVAKETAQYLDTRFKQFVTEKRTVSLPSSSKPAWEVDLVTKYEADSNGRVWKAIVAPNSLNLQAESTYDKSGNLLSSKDAMGNVTIFDYDTVGHLIATTHADGTTKGFSYDSDGRKTREIDENGHASLWRYDVLGRLLQSGRDMNGNLKIDSNDIIVSMTHNSMGQVTTTTDAMGNTLVNQYDEWHRIISSHNALGQGTFYDYSGPNSGPGLVNNSRWTPTRTMDPRGYIVEVEVDGLYRVKGQRREYKLPSVTSGDWKSRTLGENAHTETTFDLNGNSHESRAWRSPGDPPLVSKTEYDALNRPYLTTSGVGTSLETSNRTLRTSTGLTWKNIAFEGNPGLERHSSTEFDAAGRAVKSFGSDPMTGLISASSAVTETHYDLNSNVSYKIDPLGATTDFEYDVRNRQTKILLDRVLDSSAMNGSPPVRPKSVTTYDLAGNVKTVSDHYGTITETDYDPANRAVKVTVAKGLAEEAVTETEYNRNGQVIVVQDANGSRTRNFYDQLNRQVASVVNPLTGNPSSNLTSPGSQDIVVANVYDASGNLIKVADGEAEKSWSGSSWVFNEANGHVTEFTYDGVNRKTGTIWDTGSSVAKPDTCEYDALYQTDRVDAKGQRTVYTYDELGRASGVTYNGTTIDNRLNHYAGGSSSASGPGALEAVTFPNELTNRRDVVYSLDRLDRVTAETSAGVTHQYQYDVAGNRILVTYGGTYRKLVSVYDKLSRLKQVVETEAAVSDPLNYTASGGDRLTQYRYDAMARPVRLDMPNGTATHKTYDKLGRTKVIQTLGASGQVLSSFNYTDGYDAVGNVMEFSEISHSLDSRAVVNVYDKTYRLESEAITSGGQETLTSYSYDKACNRTYKAVENSAGVSSQAFVFGTPSEGFNTNQLRGIGLPGIAAPLVSSQFEITYTYDANGNRGTRSRGGLTDVYGYDYDNRLVTLDKGTAEGTGSYAYQYDYRTRRVLRDEPGTADASITFSGGTSVQEYSLAPEAGSQPSVETLRGSDMGGGVGGVLYTLRNGVAAYDAYNSRGDVVVQTNDGGGVEWQGQYEAFGTRTAEDGDNKDRQRANTKDEDPTGLLNEGMRYRDLDSGVFITRDPAGFVDGPNVYAYVQQNPWSKFDADGMFWSALITAGFAAYDTYQYATGQISGAEYAGAMALNGAALLADVATAGQGGGLAVRAANATIKVAKVVDKVDTVYSTANGAIRTAEAMANGDYTGAIVNGVLTGVGAKQMGGGGKVPDAPKVDAPKVDTPQVDTPQVDAPGGQSAQTTNVEAQGTAADALPSPGFCFIAGTEIETFEGGVPIENIRVGSRVLSSDGISSSEVDPATWRKIKLKMPNPECPSDLLDLELLRSVDWISSTGCYTGARMWLELEEIGLSGWADVLTVSDCPVISQGRGRVVLATVTHYNTFVMEVRLEGQADSMHPTDRHKLFSVTRNDWIPTASLQAGEELKTTTGTARIISVQPWPGKHRVFNIEVETDHSYFAGKSKVLSHNMCAEPSRNSVTTVDPNSIEFSHPVRLSSPFSLPAHGTVSDLAKALKNDPSLADRIPPIEVVKMRGKIYSANNRRLLAFQEANIPIRTIPATKDQVEKIRTRAPWKKK